jgi:hypothetical protein
MMVVVDDRHFLPRLARGGRPWRGDRGKSPCLFWDRSIDTTSNYLTKRGTDYYFDSTVGTVEPAMDHSRHCLALKTPKRTPRVGTQNAETQISKVHIKVWDFHIKINQKGALVLGEIAHPKNKPLPHTKKPNHFGG